MKNLKWEIKSRECGGFFFPSFFWGAGYLQSMLNSSASMVLDSGSSVRPFASSSFSAQSGTQPFVHHGGEILQQEDAIQKAFFRFKWARTNYHYALVSFFSPFSGTKYFMGGDLQSFLHIKSCLCVVSQSL
jgi:hypothetical protein